jgi:hypothetical protein
MEINVISWDTAMYLKRLIYKIIQFTLEITKLKVKFSLEQAMKAQRGSRGIALLFL